jgi:hypothetical protein
MCSMSISMFFVCFTRSIDRCSVESVPQAEEVHLSAARTSRRSAFELREDVVVLVLAERNDVVERLGPR